MGSQQSFCYLFTSAQAGSAYGTYGMGNRPAVAASCPLDEAEFEVSATSPPQTKLQGTLPWGPRVRRTKGGNLGSEDFWRPWGQDR